MPDYTLNELLNLPANAARYAALQALVEHVSQNQTDIATNGWDGSANPNSFDSHRYVLTTGSGTAYVATFSPTFGSLQDGTMLKVDFHADSGASPTLNLDSLGAKNLIYADGSNLGSGDIITGAVLPCVYSAGLDKWVVIGLTPKASIARSLGLHGTIINQAYDLDATASNSRYTPGYAGGAEFYVYFINEDSSGDATIDVNVSDGTTASQIFNDVVVPANDGVVIGPLVYTSAAYIEAAQTSGNVQMTIAGTGYASGEYLTPVTHVGLVPSAGLNLFTTGSQGGIYKLILGNLHTSDLKIRLFTTSPKTYLTSVRQSLPVNNFLAVQRVKLTGSKIVRAVEDVGTNNVVSCLATGWEV